jgi:predicted membrane protein
LSTCEHRTEAVIAIKTEYAVSKLQIYTVVPAIDIVKSVVIKFDLIVTKPCIGLYEISCLGPEVNPDAIAIRQTRTKA